MVRSEFYVKLSLRFCLLVLEWCPFLRVCVPTFFSHCGQLLKNWKLHEDAWVVTNRRKMMSEIKEILGKVRKKSFADEEKVKDFFLLAAKMFEVHPWSLCITVVKDRKTEIEIVFMVAEISNMILFLLTNYYSLLSASAFCNYCFSFIKPLISWSLNFQWMTLKKIIFQCCTQSLFCWVTTLKLYECMSCNLNFSLFVL